MRVELLSGRRMDVTTVTMMSSAGAKNACRVVKRKTDGCDDCHDDELR